VSDQETSKTRRLKPDTGLWKIQTQWVVTPGKQTTILSAASLIKLQRKGAKSYKVAVFIFLYTYLALD
jgi:hypothetical protein